MVDILLVEYMPHRLHLILVIMVLVGDGAVGAVGVDGAVDMPTIVEILLSMPIEMLL
jgi:hypothetical protein